VGPPPPGPPGAPPPPSPPCSPPGGGGGEAVHLHILHIPKATTALQSLKHVLKQTFIPKYAVFEKKIQKNIIFVRTGFGGATTHFAVI